MKMNWTAIMAGAGIVAVGAIWAGRLLDAGSGGEAILRPDDAALVDRGEELYGKNCASCHGVDLRGQPGWQTTAGKAPPHDATGHTWHHPDRMLLAVTRTGTMRRGGAMPGFAGRLSDGDIVAILSYIKSRWPEEIRAAHDRINARSAAGAG